MLQHPPLTRLAERYQRPDSLLLRYAIALIVVAGTYMLSLVIPPARAFFVVSVVLTAWFCGFGPGLLCSVIAIIVYDFQFGMTPGQLRLDAVFLARNLSFGAIVIGVDWLYRSQRVISKQHDWLQTVLASINDAVIVTDSAGRILRMNRTAQRLCNCSQSEAAGRGLAEVFPLQTPAGRALVSTGSKDAPFVIDWKEEVTLPVEGKTRYIAGSDASIVNERGQSYGWVITFRDISARREIQATLAESEDRFRRLVETSSVGTLIADESDRIVYANQALASMLGYPQKALIDGGVTWRQLSDASSSERDEQARQQLIEQGSCAPYEKIYLTRSGERVPVLVGATVLSTTPTSVAAFITDLRPLKEAERARRESEERFRQLAENIQDVFFIYDHQMEKLLYVSPSFERIFGLSAEQAKSEPEAFLESVHPEDRARLRRELSAAVKGDDPAVIEYRILREGTVQWLRLRSFKVRNDDGQIYRAAGIIEDISDRKNADETRRALLEKETQAREAAEEANRLKTRFLAMVSHELRTPLTSIAGFAQTLLAPDVKWDAEEQAEYLRIIREEANRMTALVQDLLDLSRIQSGRLPTELAPTTLGAILQTAQPQLDVVTGAHRFVQGIDDNLPSVYADKARIVQVLVNLAKNAAKYSPPGSTITLHASAQGDTVRVCISDEGPGIPAADHDAVFEMFNQLENGDEYNGAGLGLAICSGIIDAHGGSIWVEDDDTPGATLCFTIPVSEEARKPDG